MWAIEIDDRHSVQLLLAAGAYPFVTTFFNVNIEKISQNIQIMLNQAKKMHIVMNFAGVKNVKKSDNLYFPFYDDFNIYTYETEMLIKTRPRYIEEAELNKKRL